MNWNDAIQMGKLAQGGAAPKAEDSPLFSSRKSYQTWVYSYQTWVYTRVSPLLEREHQLIENPLQKMNKS